MVSSRKRPNRLRIRSRAIRTLVIEAGYDVGVRAVLGGYKASSYVRTAAGWKLNRKSA